MESLERQFVDVRFAVPWGHVAARWYGSRDARPLLALHGWLDNLGSWARLVPLLPAHVGVLCVDLPGHGRSSHLPRGVSYHVEQHAAIIGRVAAACGWPSVSLMGHSMGAVVNLVYAALYPHCVDLLIAIDIVQPVLRSPNDILKCWADNYERILVDDERPQDQQPPAYSYDELQTRQHEGSRRSVARDNCKFILERNIAPSPADPRRFSFTRDNRLKYSFAFTPSRQLARALTSRIRDKPFIVIKAAQSAFIDGRSGEFVQMLREQNPHFELHELPGTHHVHLNDAEAVAARLNPFICRHRPAAPESAAPESASLEVRENLPRKSKL